MICGIRLDNRFRRSGKVIVSGYESFGENERIVLN